MGYLSEARAAMSATARLILLLAVTGRKLEASASGSIAELIVIIERDFPTSAMYAASPSEASLKSAAQYRQILASN